MRDTVDPEFASYVDARQSKWLRSAYLVYGDLPRAEDELLHAFSRLATVWTRVDDPDVFVQRLLYRAALSRWNRTPKAEYESEGQPVRVALAGLTPLQRAVLVLLHHEELTELEVADVLGMSHTAVHAHAQAALSRFRAGLGLGDWRNAGDRP